MILDENTKEVINLLETGTAFNVNADSTIVAVRSTLSSFTAPAMVGVDSSITSTMNSTQQAIRSLGNQIPDFSAHVQQQFESLPDKISLFASSQGLSNAMSGSTGCDSLHTWFGSLTGQSGQVGGALSMVSDFKRNVVDQMQKVQNVYTALRTSVGDAKDRIIGNLQFQLVDAATSAQAGDIQAAITKVENLFLNADANARQAIAAEATALLSADRAAVVNSFAEAMGIQDTSLSQAVTQFSAVTNGVVIDASALTQEILNENTLVEEATNKLITLGQASGMRSLFKGNTCVGTLMGYVGTDALLKRLG
jgi:hypothetical protein